MDISNVEIKARIDLSQYLKIQNYLNEHSTKIGGTDHQTDYYFKTSPGRLKLRIGNIEKSLIYYERNEVIGLKNSSVILHKINGDAESLLDVLMQSNTLWKEVQKKREIYFIDNIKFHLDTIKNLGTFLEIEAISQNGLFDSGYLESQCRKYMEIFEVKKGMLIDKSYSDMI